MTDYYFGQGGSDSNNGLSFANRKATYANVISTYSPGGGDTVYVCAATAGVQWTCTERMQIQSGTSTSSRFRISASPGSVILFDVSIGGRNGALWGLGADYWTIEPGEGSFEWGDTNDWSVSNYDGYSADRQFDLETCTNGEFIGTGTGNLDTTNSNLKIHGGSDYFGNMIEWDCDLIRFYGVDFSLHGTTDTQDFPTIGGQPGLAGFDWGEMVDVRGTHILFDTCCISEGGHDNFEILGHWVIIQNSNFSGYHRSTEDSGTTTEGMRCMSSLGGHQGNDGMSPWGPQLFQNNIYEDTRRSDQRDNPLFKFETGHAIVRGCYMWDAEDRIWQSNPNSAHGSNGSVTRLKIYHNTSYNTGSIGSFMSTVSEIQTYTNMFEYCAVLNNIFDQLGTPVFDRPHFRRYANLEQDDSGFGDNGWKGMQIRANIVVRSTAADVNCEFRPISGSSNLFTWSEGNTDYPAVFDDDNVEGAAPSYVGTPGFPAFERSRATFTPNGGIETGAADPVATTNGAVVDSNTLTLQNGESLLFKDDWGMSSLGIGGDYIYLSEIDEIRQITSVDYTGNAATIVISGSTVVLSDNSPIYWVREDGITACTAIGAGQVAAVVEEVPPVMNTTVWVHR